jgi:kinesin family member 2/24
LVDLAGTEWDTGHYEKERRQEAAEINKSLMALKECIRALDSKKHVPYRTSKMTMMLRDSFVSEHAKVVMIVCVSPAIS